VIDVGIGDYRALLFLGLVATRCARLNPVVAALVVGLLGVAHSGILVDVEIWKMLYDGTRL
jgi:hypothetical protein